jgi:hypothetical protein
MDIVRHCVQCAMQRAYTMRQSLLWSQFKGYLRETQNLCRTTEICAVQQNFVSYDKLLCRMTKVSVVRHKYQMAFNLYGTAQNSGLV